MNQPEERGPVFAKISISVRGIALVSAAAAASAVLTFNAGGAVAASTCPVKATNIQGEGTSLQRILQEKLTGREAPNRQAGETLPVLPHAVHVPPEGYAQACPEGPTASYTNIKGQSGLETFRYVGSAARVDIRQAFVAVDDPPNASQISFAQSVTGSAKSLVIPVAETSIAIVIHPPTGCKFQERRGITWKDLNKVFGGNAITGWNQFENIEGACEASVTRVVPAESSGVAYQFKNYLSVLETKKGASGLPCATEGHTRWAELEEVGSTEGRPNTSWPQCSGSSSLVKVGGLTATGRYVQANAGTIGFLSLPDAKSTGAEMALLQDQEEEGVKRYGPPGTTEGMSNISNCGVRVYTVPAPGRVGESGESVDWSRVSGAVPTVGSSHYPLCTLTYDLSWTSYFQAGYGASATSAKEAAKDYLDRYVLSSEGQTAANDNWYQKLPGSNISENDVLGAARLAASKIN